MRMHLSPTLLVFAVLFGLSADVFAQISSPPKTGIVPFDLETAKQLQDAWARHLSTAKTVKNSLGMELILIPPGKLRLGNEDATLAEPFYLGRTEVTQAEWSALMETTPWKGKEQSGEKRPATFVSWNEAKEFCQRLTAKEKNGTYRLPTEAEWEYACRAGTTTPHSFGDDPTLLGQFAWCATNAKRAGEKYPHDVALKKPNPFGLFDMHGNVWEYCDGTYTSDPTSDAVPTRAKTGPLRVAAGGSWTSDLSVNGKDDSVFHCRSNSRTWPSPNDSDHSTGFRVVWNPPAKK
jgi:formylglycine-generating enzyme required for sulfatase activity